jgi:hypothetical protein
MSSKAWRRKKPYNGKDLAMNIDQADANENMDMPAHVKTYQNFMTFMKFGIGTVVIVLICMAIFLT